MNVLLKCLTVSLFLTLSPLVNSQIIEEPGIECDPALVERYDRLIEQSKNRNREERIGWLNSASTACPSYEYFMELGRIWSQSTLDSELASAADAFSSARHIASDAANDARNDSKFEEAEMQIGNIASSLFEHAELLVRQDSPQSAQLLINELKLISPNYGELNAVEDSISRSLSHEEVSRNTAWNLFSWPPIPASDETQLKYKDGVKEVLSKAKTFSELLNLVKTILINGATKDGYSFEYKLYEIPASNTDLVCSSPEDCPNDSTDTPSLNGFIIVTENERIDHSGLPVAKQRWRVDTAHRTGILRALRRRIGPVPPDYVRVMAFIVYNGDYSNLNGPEMENATAKLNPTRTLSNACLPITPAHEIDVSIYEYEFGEQYTGIEDLKPIEAPISADEHLQRTLIYDALMQPYNEVGLCPPQG